MPFFAVARIGAVGATAATAGRRLLTYPRFQCPSPFRLKLLIRIWQLLPLSPDSYPFHAGSDDFEGAGRWRLPAQG